MRAIIVQPGSPLRPALRAVCAALRVSAAMLIVCAATASVVFADCKDATKEWAQLSASRDKARLQAFADRYSDCPEAGRARQRIRELETPREAPRETPRQTPPRRNSPSSGSTRPTPPPPRPAAEQQLWDAIKDLSEPEPFENYLKQYPEGKYAEQARQRAKMLRNETDYWKRIESSSEAEVFAFYLKEVAAGRYPGRYKAEAEAKLEGIEQSEDTAWKAIQGGTEPGLFERYLKDYPRGKYAAEAEEKVRTLREEQLWRRVGNSRDPEDVEKYLKEYPRGKYASEASERIDSLRDEMHWAKIEKSRDPADFEKYLELFPKGRHVSAARERASRPPGATEFFGPILNRKSNKTIDVGGWSKDDGAPVQQWTYARQANQRWEVIQLDQRRVAIINEHSGKVLEGSSDGKVRQALWRNGDNQKWRLEPGGGGHYRIVNVKSGQCLAVDEKSKKDGAGVELAVCKNAAHQEWRLAR